MDPRPPAKPPGRKVPLWMVVLGGIGTLAPLAWYLGPGIVMSLSRGCRTRRQVAVVLAGVQERLRPRITITLDVPEGGFVQWSGGSAGLAYTLRFKDEKPAPTERLAHMSVVDASRGSVAEVVINDLVALLERDPVERGDANNLSWEAEETVSALPDELLREVAFLHVCCLYFGGAVPDTVYTEQVFRFNINRDGLGAMPVADTTYHRP